MSDENKLENIKNDEPIESPLEFVQRNRMNSGSTGDIHDFHDIVTGGQQSPKVDIVKETKSE